MSKKFEDFQSKPENYTDFEKSRHTLDGSDLFVDDTTPEQLRTLQVVNLVLI